MTPIVKELPRHRDRVNCESEMLDPSTIGYGKFKCDKLATYTIDGKPMCKRHAGSYLVNLLAKNEG